MKDYVICPTVTAFTKDEYKSQIEAVRPFAKRLHIDLMDGEFAPSRSPALDNIWLPEGQASDIHLMYRRPLEQVEALLKLEPALVIIHHEAEGDHRQFSRYLHEAGLKTGLALLQETSVEAAASLLPDFDHVLIFSGHLGYHGGEADLRLLYKVKQVRELFPEIEISWDGGITIANARALVGAGVNVLNVGGFIQAADNPEAAYNQLVNSLET